MTIYHLFTILGLMFWFVCSLAVAHRIITLKVVHEYGRLTSIVVCVLGPFAVLAEFFTDTIQEIEMKFRLNSNNEVSEEK